MNSWLWEKHLSFAALKIQAGSSTYLLGHSQATTKALEFRNPNPQGDMPTKEGMFWLLWRVRFTGGEER